MSALKRLAHDSKEAFCSLHSVGIGAIFSIDGWAIPLGEKWLGFCALLRTRDSGGTMACLSGVKNVSLDCEGEQVICAELEKEIITKKEHFEEVTVDDVRKSLVVCVVTNSAAGTVPAKKTLAQRYPENLWLPCFAHQLNIFAWNLLTHPSSKPLIADAKRVVTFFNAHSKQMAFLRKVMVAKEGRFYNFVVEGKTHLYSHLAFY